MAEDTNTSPATSDRKPWSAKRIILWTLAGLVIAFVVIQLVPYGRDHTNPPVTATANWPDAQTEALARGACYDCHSNETEWPWYSNVAPMSWLTYHDVVDGRDAFNLSEAGGGVPDEVGEAIDGGAMPPPQYKLLHSSGRLTDAQRAQLVSGFQQMTVSPSMGASTVPTTSATPTP